MKVLFDFGNSLLKWAIGDTGNQVVGSIDGGDLQLLTARLEQEFAGRTPPTQAWISSVASQTATRALVAWIHQAWSIDARLLSACAEAYGVSNAYDQPDTLGSDRWAALIAVRHRYSQPACIVDCGTAITIDLIQDNRFRGGVILPGLEMSRTGLQNGTARLHMQDPQDNSCVATSTSTGIESGTLMGIAGAIERIVQCQQQQAGAAVSVYLTGGNAAQILTKLSLPCTVVDDLVLQGLDVAAGIEA